MNQDQTNLQTIIAGVERLRQGIPFSFNDIRFSVHIEETQLDVGAFTSWLNITIETATGDLKRAQTTYLYLNNEFPEFATFVDGLTPRFSVIQDMGNCHVELAYLNEDDTVLR